MVERMGKNKRRDADMQFPTSQTNNGNNEGGEAVK